MTHYRTGEQIRLDSQARYAGEIGFAEDAAGGTPIAQPPRTRPRGSMRRLFELRGDPVAEVWRDLTCDHEPDGDPLGDAGGPRMGWVAPREGPGSRDLGAGSPLTNPRYPVEPKKLMFSL